MWEGIKETKNKKKIKRRKGQREKGLGQGRASQEGFGRMMVVLC